MSVAQANSDSSSPTIKGSLPLVVGETVVEKPAFYAQMCSSGDVYQTLRQRKLSTVMLWFAVKQGLTADRRRFQAPVRELCRVLNIKDVNCLADAFIGLQNIYVQTRVNGLDGAFDWEGYTIVSWAKISGMGLSGIAEWEYAVNVHEKLISPERVARLNLETVRKFRSLSGLSLYENLMTCEEEGVTDWWDYQFLCDLLGVKPDVTASYSFKVFSSRYLKKAIEEVTEHTGLDIDTEFKRTGRCVSHVRLIFRENAQANLSLDFQQEPQLDHALVTKLVAEYGQTETWAKEFVSTMDTAVIERTLVDVDQRVAKRSISPSRVGGYVFKILKSGGLRETKAERERVHQEQLVKHKEQQERMRSQVKYRFDEYLSGLVFQRWTAASAETQEKLFAEFAASNKFFTRATRDETGRIKLAVGPFSSWLRSKLLMASEQDFDSYAKSQADAA